MFSHDRDLAFQQRAPDAWRLMVDHAHHFFGLLDADGTVLEVNQRVLELRGLPREQVLSRRIWESPVWPSAERVRLQEAVTRAAQGNQVGYETSVCSAIGQQMTLDFSLRPIADGGKVIYLLAEGHDSSARKQAEVALERQRVFLQAVLDNISDGVAACDAEGRLTVFNPATRALHELLELPLSADEWAQHYSLYRPDSTTPLETDEVPLYRALQGEEVRDVEMVIAPKGGVRRRIVANGRALRSARGDLLGAVVAMHDVTATTAAETALREREAQHRAVIDALSGGIVQHDREGHITSCNPAAERLLGLSRAQLMEGRPPDTRWRLVHEDGTPLSARSHPAMLALRTGEPQEGVVLGVHKPSGTLTWVLVNCQPLWQLYETTPYAVVSSLTDITPMKQTEGQLRYRALHDTLTGLPMRALFRDRLEQAVSRAERNPDFHFAVLYIDLDGFKGVNDILGHSIGDNLLVTVARQLERCVRAGDTVARLGGDEFTMLVEHLAQPQDAVQLAERLLHDLAISLKVAGREVSVSASIGIALSNQQRHARDLVDAADVAMYRAKAAGKAQYRVFERPALD